MNGNGSNFPVTKQDKKINKQKADPCVSFASQALMSQCKECEVWNEAGLAILLNNFHLPHFPGNRACTEDRHTLKENTARRGEKHLLRERGERAGKQRLGKGAAITAMPRSHRYSVWVFFFKGLREKTVSILLPAARSFLFWLHDCLASWSANCGS